MSKRVYVYIYKGRLCCEQGRLWHQNGRQDNGRLTKGSSHSFYLTWRALDAGTVSWQALLGINHGPRESTPSHTGPQQKQGVTLENQPALFPHQPAPLTHITK